MSTVNDGGSAFPIANDDRPGAYPAETGMSLRDWFAGQALVGVMASPREVVGIGLAGSHARVAEICFSAADALLAAREVKP